MSREALGSGGAAESMRRGLHGPIIVENEREIRTGM